MSIQRPGSGTVSARVMMEPQGWLTRAWQAVRAAGTMAPVIGPATATGSRAEEDAHDSGGWLASSLDLRQGLNVIEIFAGDLPAWSGAAAA